MGCLIWIVGVVFAVRAVGSAFDGDWRAVLLDLAVCAVVAVVNLIGAACWRCGSDE